jgi:hypothetical protein
MKSQSVGKFVLVMALVVGVISVATPIFAQSSSSAPDGTGTEPPKVLARPETPPSALTGGAALNAVALAYYRVAGAAFTPRYNTTAYSYGQNPGAGGICVTAAPSGDGVLHTPVYLPQGAVVNGLRMYFYRLDTSTSCTGWFTVYNRQTGAILQEFSVIPGTYTGYNYNDASPFSLTIDNSQYTYMLNWRPDSTSYSANMTLVSFLLFNYPPATANKVAVIPLY